MSNLSELLPTGGGQNSVEFVASGALASGQTVALKTNGQVEAVSALTQSAGTPVVFEAADIGSGQGDPSIAFDSNSNKIVIAYTDVGNSSHGTAIVGTVSGNSISYGTAVVFEADTTTYPSVCFDSNSNKMVIAYRDGGASNHGKAIVGTVSGTSISFGTAVTFESANSDHISATFDSNSNKVVIAYGDDGNSSYGTAIVGTVSGTSISFGSPTVFESANSKQMSAIFDSSNNKVVIAYRDFGNSSYGTAIVGTVSGTGISFGSATVYSSASSDYISATFDSSNNKVVITYQDGSDHGNAIVGTVSGTGISFGTGVVYEAAVTKYPAITFDSNANQVVISYSDNGNNDYGTMIVGTVSGTSLSFDSPVIFAGSGYARYIGTGYDSNLNKVVTAYQDGNNSNYGTSVVIQTASSNNTSFIGITAGAISNSATGKVNVYGGINEAQSGLTIASDYYVQANGSLAAGATSIPFDISSASYTQSFSVSSQSTDPVGLVFSPDGTSMYVVSGVYPPGAKNIFQYALTTAFDISTASLSKDFNSSGQDSQARGIQFNADGTKMFINGVTGDAYYQYSLSSAYDISTGSYDSVSFSFSSQDGNMEDVVFNADGTKFYGVGLNTSKIFQYSCSSAFNLATASYDSVSLTISSQDNSPRDLFFKPDGSKMWLLGRQNNSIYQYSLSSNFNLATASYDSISFSVSSEETSSGGLAFSANGEKFYVCGGTGDDVNQYATTQTAFVTTVKAGQAISATTINMKDLT